MIDWQKFNVNVLTTWYVLSFASPSYVCMFFVSADKYLTCFLCTVLNLKIFFKGFFNNSAFCGVKFTVFSPDFLFVILHIAAKFRICVFFWILILYNHRNRKFNQIESTKQRSAGTYKNSAASAGIKNRPAEPQIIIIWKQEDSTWQRKKLSLPSSTLQKPWPRKWLQWKKHRRSLLPTHRSRLTRSLRQLLLLLTRCVSLLPKWLLRKQAWVSWKTRLSRTITQQSMFTMHIRTLRHVVL